MSGGIIGTIPPVRIYKPRRNMMPYLRGPPRVEEDERQAFPPGTDAALFPLSLATCVAMPGWRTRVIFKRKVDMLIPYKNRTSCLKSLTS